MDTITIANCTSLLTDEERATLAAHASALTDGSPAREAILKALRIDEALRVDAGVILEDGSYGSLEGAVVYSAEGANAFDADDETELYEALEVGDVLPRLTISVRA